MLDSVYYMTLNYLKIAFLWCEDINILPSFAQGYNGGHYVTLIFCKPQEVY